MHPISPTILSRDEKDLIKMLRKEASDVKDCFTRFSFQAIAFSAPVLGVLAGVQIDPLVIAFATFALVSLLLAVARVGTYKYATANRHFGYELHLQRTGDKTVSYPDGWQESMRSIGWEEALRAWRIVQATVFDHLYYTPFFGPNILKRGHRSGEYQWFRPKMLLVEGASYHAGSYLRNMLTILHTLSFLSLAPLMLAIYKASTKRFSEQPTDLLIAEALAVALTVFVLLRIAKDIARRIILEKGLLCIHSSAIMWQAVVVAHYRALSKLREHGVEGQDYGVQYKAYTRALSKEAIELKMAIFDIHEWVKHPIPLPEKEVSSIPQSSKQEPTEAKKPE